MSRELLKRALAEILGEENGASINDLVRDIEAELSKPEPEPVAWGIFRKSTMYDFSHTKPDAEFLGQMGDYAIPLYAEPLDQSARVAELESQLSDCRKLLATRVEAHRLSEANEQIAELQAQRSMQEEIIKSAYARCRELEQRLSELQTQRKPLTDDEICEIWAFESDKDPIKFAQAVENAHGIIE